MQQTGKGQTIAYKKYTSKDGLANSSIYRICQDENNFLWMTTNHGIVKFDGYNFENFYPNELQSSTFGIASDKAGHIWAGDLHSAIYRITPNENKSIKYLPPKTVEKKIPEFMAMSANDKVWVAYDNKSAGFIDSGLFHKVKIVNAQNSELQVHYVYADHKKQILLATNHGVYIAGNGYKPKSFIDGFTSLVYKIVETDRNEYYLAGNGVIYTYIKGKLDSLIIPIKKEISCIAVTPDNRIWLAFDEQPGFYCVKDGIMIDFSGYTDLKNVFVYTIYTDKKGNIFLGTKSKGLYILNNVERLHYNEYSGLSSNSISCLVEDDEGKLYVGGYGGITVLEADKFQLVKYFPIKPFERVNDILFSEDNIWVATPHHIYRYNAKTKKLLKNACGGTSFEIGRNGTILVGSYEYVINFGQYSGIADTPVYKLPGINKTRVEKVLKVSGDTYWFAADNIIIRQRNGLFSSFTPDNSPIQGLARDAVEDNHGNMWFATNYALLKYDTSGKWHSYTTKDGLSDNYCTRLIYHKGILWIGTMRGLCSFDGEHFRQYGSGYGLPTEEIVSIYCDRQDNMWICMGDGLYKWPLAGIRNNISVPDVIIKSVRTDRENKSLDEEIILPFKDNNFSVNFVAVEYFHQDDIEYEYRIANIEHDWRKAQGRSLEFSSLSPGHYLLEIRARNKNSRQVSNPAVLEISVLKPVWQQWWFIICCLVIIVGSTGMLLQLRINRIKAREKKRANQYAKLLRLRQQATHALVSPHFIFNSLNSIQNYINKADKSSANKFLSKFSKLIRSTMESSTRLNTRLSDELDMLQLYLSLEQMRLGNKLSYDIVIDPSIAPSQVKIPAMLIQPFVENAIWHGITPKDAAGHIVVKIKWVSDVHLSILIEDNGIGLDVSGISGKKPFHTPRGMNINQQRLDIIRLITGKAVKLKAYTLFDENAMPSGTRVELLMPYKKITAIKKALESYSD